MSFPLDIRTELKVDGAWSDISSDVYLRDTKQITRGLRDQGSAADPSTLSLTLNNRAGKYSPRNALSPLYGKIGRNTQVRLSVPGFGDSYLELDGGAGNYALTPDAASLEITGDIDVRWEGSPNWYGPEDQMLMGKWDDANDQCSWMFSVYKGDVTFRYSTTGDQRGSNAWFGRTLPRLPVRAALRATLTFDGTGKAVGTMYWAESLDGPWNMIEKPIPMNPGAAYDTIFSGSAPLQIGITDLRHDYIKPIPRYPVVGRCYRAEVRRGVDGPVVASPDFRASQDRDTSVTDAQGHVWTLHGGAEIRDRENRFVGEISYWPLRWTPDDADVWVSVTASGVLRRMGQGNKPLESTLRRRIPSGSPTAYWPCEESKDAKVAYSPLPGIQPAQLTGVQWASANTLESSAPLPVLGTESSLTAIVPKANTGEWQVEFVYNAFDKIAPESGNYAPLIGIYTPNGSVVRWELSMKQGVAQILGYSKSGAQKVNQLIGIGDDVWHGWTRLRFWAENNSDGTLSARLDWQGIGDSAGGLTVTTTGTVGWPTLVYANWNALNEGWAFGHLFVLPTANNTLLDGSDDAYLGETAYARMMRLAEEQGFSVSRLPGDEPLMKVGYQRPEKLIDLFEAPAKADGGLLTEAPDRLCLRYRDRSSMYNQTPALTLSYNEPGLGADLEPIDDDTGIFNDVTITRDGGSSFRAYQPDGPMSIENPPYGIGRYDTSETLSLGDDALTEGITYWRLYLGTFNGARYPTVTVNLHKPGAEVLIPDVLRLREGDKIRLTDLPQWVSNDDVDLLVMGWTEQLDMYTWTVTYNCVPAEPWNVAQADAVKADTDGSELATALSASATSLSVAVTDGPLWTTNPADMPMPIRVDGEVMTVTAISGTSSPQTFTVTRAVNGVSKPHDAGTPLSLATAPIASL